MIGRTYAESARYDEEGGLGIALALPRPAFAETVHPIQPP